MLCSLTLYSQDKKDKQELVSIECFCFGDGYLSTITIKKGFAELTINRKEKKWAYITSDIWNFFKDSIQLLNLSTIDTIKSPTSARELDGASYCKIIIQTRQKKYETQYFDGGKPMILFQSIYKKIDLIEKGIRENVETE